MLVKLTPWVSYKFLQQFCLEFRINSTHTFLAGGYVVVTEAEDPLTNRQKPPSSSPDIVSAGAVPRRNSQVSILPRMFQKASPFYQRK